LHVFADGSVGGLDASCADPDSLQGMAYAQSPIGSAFFGSFDAGRSGEHSIAADN